MADVSAEAQSRMTRPITTVLLGASSFGFGPAGVALNIAKALSSHAINTVFVGDGAACELASRDPAQYALEIPDGTDADRVAFIGAAVERYCATAVVSSMSPEMVRAAKSRAIPSVWVESLLWWDDIPIAPEAIHADVYIRHRSLPDDERLAAVELARMATVTSVGPITWPGPLTRSPKQRRRPVVVNVGGLREPVGQYGALYRLYARLIMDTVRELREALGRESVLLVGPGWIGEAQAAATWEAPPSQPRFIEIINDADVLVTAPGLGAPFEAWMHDIPVVFLPPCNQSQIEQLRQYRALALTTIDDDDLRAMPTLAEVYRRFAVRASRELLCSSLIAEITRARTTPPQPAIRTYLNSLEVLVLGLRLLSLLSSLTREDITRHLWTPLCGFERISVFTEAKRTINACAAILHSRGLRWPRWSSTAPSVGEERVIPPHTGNSESGNRAHSVNKSDGQPRGGSDRLIHQMKIAHLSWIMKIIHEISEDRLQHNLIGTQ